MFTICQTTVQKLPSSRRVYVYMYYLFVICSNFIVEEEVLEQMYNIHTPLQHGKVIIRR
jgi:hypothetical protein